MYKLTQNPNQVQRLSDNAFIPFDNNNVDYQKYLEWVSQGNQPVERTRYPMYILQILEQARARNVAEQYYLYTQSEEGKAAAIELERLRAECDAAEAKCLATCARCDAERAEEVADQATIDQATIDYCFENGISWEDRNA